MASEFARRHYRDKLGLDCQVLPYPVDWERVGVDEREPRYVTFVNPALYKGAYPFVRIAQELGRRRPDIPLLGCREPGNAEDAGRLRAQAVRPSQYPDHAGDHRSAAVLAFDQDSADAVAVVGNAGLVAVEAMINGIPVIGSDRGALPETLGEGGIALSLPERLTPVSQILPTAEEVEPWVEAMIGLWDDPAWYQDHERKGQPEPSSGIPIGFGRCMPSSSAKRMSGRVHRWLKSRPPRLRPMAIRARCRLAVVPRAAPDGVQTKSKILTTEGTQHTEESQIRKGKAVVRRSLGAWGIVPGQLTFR